MPERVADIRFNGFLLGERTRFLRNVEGHDRLIGVPDHLSPTVDRIWSAVMERLASDADLQDFRVICDGVPYRGSRIRGQSETVFNLRVLPTRIPTFEHIGQSPSISRRLLQSTQLGGLVLFAGTTGSGKTTSASALFAHLLRARGGLGITVESPCEFMIEGSHGAKGGYALQIEVSGGDFRTPLSEAMRHQPDVILVGEIKDPAAAAEALKIAASGHPVLATIHGNDVAAAVQRMLHLAAGNDGNLESIRSLLADVLSAVVHQRLEGQPRQLVQSALFFDEELSPKNKVREGLFHQLQAEVTIQADRMHAAERQEAQRRSSSSPERR